MKIATDVGSVHWAIHDDERARRYHDEVALPMTLRLRERGLVDSEFLNTTIYRIRDFQYTPNPPILARWREMCEDWPIDKDRPDRVVGSLQCSGCKLIRGGRLEDGKACIDIAHERLQKYMKDRAVPPDKESAFAVHLAYLDLLDGIYHYRTGEYDEARSCLERAEAAFREARSTYDPPARALVYYFLGKIGALTGESPALVARYRELAKAKIGRHKNYCMVDLEEIIQDLRDD